MGKVVWLCGLSGAGKSTIADVLQKKLEARGKKVKIIDGDYIRSTINKHLGFTDEDIIENNRIISTLAKEEIETFDFVLVPVISSLHVHRDANRERIGEHYIECFVDAPIEECIRRDVKGLYAKAISGEITNMVGYSKVRPFENPRNPEIHVRTAEQTPEESAEQILGFLDKN